MGMYKYLHKLKSTPEYEQLMKDRLIGWRLEPTMLRIERPTKLERAHSLGYKAKQGFVLVRIKIGKGSSKRETTVGGRKPANTGKYAMPPKQNLQHISEMRVARKFPNLEVLNSYEVAEDGKQKWFEVILVDPNHSCIKNDKKLNWICESKRRVFRGLTSAAKRHR